MICPKCGSEVAGKFCQNCGTECVTKENLKETIQNLYALRTGISYSCVKAEEYKNEKKNFENKLAELEKRNDRHRNLMLSAKREVDFCEKRNVNFNKDEYISQKNKLNKLNRDMDYYKDNESKYYGRSNSFDKAGTVTRVISIILTVLCVFVILPAFAMSLMHGEINFGNPTGDELAAILVCTIPPILAIIFWTITICLAVASSKSSKQGFEFSRMYDNAANEYEQLNHILEPKTKILETKTEADKKIKNGTYREAKATVDSIKKQMDQTALEIAETKKDLSTKPQVHLSLSKSMYRALVKTYSALIDTRDWQNLDLVIFYLETGRADSMKEALQLVDRQIQNDNIVNALSDATYSICSTITNGLAHINQTIIGATKILSSQLMDVSSHLSDISYKQDKLSAKVSELASVTNESLKLALEKKSDTSSRQMMDDLHQMRIYADNAAIRARNS